MVRLRACLGGLLLQDGDEAAGEQETPSLERRFRAVFSGGPRPLLLLLLLLLLLALSVGVIGVSGADPSLRILWSCSISGVDITSILMCLMSSW